MPPSAPCAIPVSVTLPVLVSMNAWQGPTVPPMGRHRMPAPTPRVAEGLQLVGASAALTTRATPVPERPTGEPVTGTLAVMVTDPVAAPSTVGEKDTVIVHVAAAGGRVAPQVPPARANGPPTTTVIPVRF